MERIATFILNYVNVYYLAAAGLLIMAGVCAALLFIIFIYKRENIALVFRIEYHDNRESSFFKSQYLEAEDAKEYVKKFMPTTIDMKMVPHAKLIIAHGYANASIKKRITVLDNVTFEDATLTEISDYLEDIAIKLEITHDD